MSAISYSNKQVESEQSKSYIQLELTKSLLAGKRQVNADEFLGRSIQRVNYPIETQEMYIPEMDFMYDT